MADSIISRAIADSLVPGAVFLVSRSGEILIERGYGVAQAMEWKGGDGRAGLEGEGGRAMTRGGNPYHSSPEPLDPPRPMSTETVFDLASVTKVMATTMALMVLESRGLVELEASVHRYLPAFQRPEKEEITLRHLLTHTSGLAQWQPLYYWASTPEETLQVIAGLPLAWEVGSGRHYSDLGFMVLGGVVEAVSGRTLDHFLEDEIYGPLGLARTGFRPSSGPFAATSHGNPFEYRMVHDSTFGYRFRGDPRGWDGWRYHTLVGEVNDGNAHHAYGGVAGHAGLFSTAGELHRLLRVLLDQGVYSGGSGDALEMRLFDARTVQDFLAPALANQALGWQVPSWAPAGSFSHTGFTGTFVMGIPDRDMAVVLLTNRQNYGVDSETRYPDLGRFQQEVMEALLRDP